MECSKRRPAFEETWLLDIIKKEGWCILQKDALKVAEKLGLDKEHYSYYPTVRVFLPQLYANWTRPDTVMSADYARKGMSPRHKT